MNEASAGFDLGAVRSWLQTEGLGGHSLADLLGGFSERLAAAGMPLARTYMALPTLSADLRAINVTWLRGQGATRENVVHDRFPNAFEGSPIAYLLNNKIPRHRWRLSESGGDGGYGLLRDLRNEGFTDYAAHIVAFGAREAFAVQGVGLTACSDSPDGFSDRDIDVLTELATPLALSAYRIALFDITVDVLGAYLGHDAGRRVLNGEMRRGEGHRVGAALMVTDLTGFTAAAETGEEGLVAELGHHLAAMVEPVEAEGGEVLKFLGDGILAAFPYDDAGSPASACAAALRAGIEALNRNRRIQRDRGRHDLGLKVAFHRGEVFYGNVGAGTRLDFTVIGPAVNEACRIEALCGSLGRTLLMSEPFAEACGRRTISLGSHLLRNVAEPREIYTLQD